MAAYIIANIRLNDTDQYAEYVKRVPALIEQHGGRYLVRGGESSALEGDWSPSRFIVIEFPDRSAAQKFYDDPRYEPYKKLRQSISDSTLILIDGFQ